MYLALKRRGRQAIAGVPVEWQRAAPPTECADAGASADAGAGARTAARPGRGRGRRGAAVRTEAGAGPSAAS